MFQQVSAKKFVSNKKGGRRNVGGVTSEVLCYYGCYVADLILLLFY
jgi:hypothetical protein